MRRTVALAACAVFALLTLVAAPQIGMETVPLEALFDPLGTGKDATIVWRVRMPRIAMAFVAGAALAVGGLAFQALFRNPLATPFTLGTSSGAALGVALSLRLGFTFSWLGLDATTVAGFLGASLSVVLVYALTAARAGFSAATMLLAGVAVSFFFSSLILFIQYTSSFYDSFKIVRWVMGGVGFLGFSTLLGVLPWVALGVGILACLTNELNLLTLGDDLATSRGVDVRRARRLIFFATAFIVGGVVSACGPIGFVGLMAPHICRVIVGGDHRVLLPASFLFGGGFLVLCDTVARTIIAPADMPVGIITAFLGGPFFLLLLLSRRSRIDD